LVELDVRCRNNITIMGTWNAFYVRAQGGDAIAAIRERFPDAEIESSLAFLGVKMPDEAFEAPEADLAALSTRLATDVIWLGFQSVVDAFQFHRWHLGQHARALVYGCFKDERTWERVEGESEPWEREVLFSQRELDHVLTYAGSDSERQELQRIWRDAEISPGRMEPGLDSRDCAHKIAAHYNLPHYGL
jgi:hypothetical protein